MTHDETEALCECDEPGGCPLCGGPEIVTDTPKTATSAELTVAYGISTERLEEEAARCAELSADTPEGYEEVRLTIRRLTSTRSEIERRRKALKADSLAYGRRVDSVAKVLVSSVRAIEDPLREKKEAVDAIERAEKERAEREAREAEERAEAERRAAEEAERAAEEAERAAERAKLEAERKALDEARAKIEADRRELEREAAELAAKKAARDALEAAEREAEEKAVRDAERAADLQRRREALMPDSERLRAYGDRLRAVPHPGDGPHAPLESPEARAAMAEAEDMLDEVCALLEGSLAERTARFK